MTTAPALDAFAQQVREQSEALVQAFAPLQAQTETLLQHFTQQQRLLDSTASLLGSIEGRTAEDLQHLRDETRSIARDHSDLARRVDALLRRARKRSRYSLHVMAAALTGDGAACAELQYLASTGDQLAACALALALELDALTERVRVLVEAVAQTLTAQALAALADTEEAPPPSSQLAGTVEANAPPREAVCERRLTAWPVLDFPARKDAVAI